MFKNQIGIESHSLLGVSTARAAVVHLNFRAWSTFPVPVCTVSPGHWVNKQTLIRTSRCNKADRSGVRDRTSKSACSV